MTAFDFAGIVRDFANAWNLELARETPPTFIDGMAIPGGWVRVTVPEAFVRPVQTRLTMVSGSMRIVESIKIAVQTGLSTGYDTPARGDVVAWQGAIYRVEALADWRVAAGFLDATAVRQDCNETTLDAWVAAEGGEALEAEAEA